jgi:hypothetical protein
MKVFSMWILMAGILMADPILELSFDVNLIHQNPKGDSGKEFEETKSSFHEQVFLSKKVIEYGDKDKRKIINFPKNKIYLSIPQKKTYVESSLYSDIGFRVIEFRNRQQLSGILGSAGLNDNPMSDVLSEHMFSLRSKNPTKLTATVKDKNVTFSHEGKTLFSFIQGKYAVSASQLKQFISFLRYRLGVHPDVLDYLAKEQNLPFSFIYKRYNIANDFYTYKLKKVETLEKAYEVSSKQIEEEHSQLSKISHRARSLREQLPKLLKETLERAKHFAEQQDNLTAVMLFIEYTLISGEPMPKEFLQYRALFMKDTDVKLLFKSAGAKNKGEAEQGLIELQKLKKKSLVDNELIMIFQCNLLNSLNRQQEAKSKAVKILNNKPYITGFWKDLGDMYYKEYDSVSTWQCWDTARFLVPKHKMLLGINQYEKKLELDHPEFFTP